MPWEIGLDSSGNLYIADGGNFRIRKVTLTTGIITTVAGNGTYGHTGNGGKATSAEIYNPWGVALDSSGNLYIGGAGPYNVSEVYATSGIITNYAGNGTQGYSGDGGQATSAELEGAIGRHGRHPLIQCFPTPLVIRHCFYRHSRPSHPLCPMHRRWVAVPGRPLLFSMRLW